MKKLVLTILVSSFLAAAHAQVPQALNYQAIARNSMGQIIPSQPIGIRFTVLDLTGTNILYQETQTSTTNNFGLFTLAIGKGTAVSGTFAAIDWSAVGDKFLKVEIAPQGGTNYTIQGITQLLSVPYALYSEKTRLIAGNAITITNGNTISANYVAGNAITITGNTIAGNYLAGAGISISGNTISSTANLNSWLLNGNTGTNASNFVGTTDNQALNFRTNNIPRLGITHAIAGTNNIGYVTAGSEATMSTQPVQLGVLGKDIVGSSIPMYVGGSVFGMTWNISAGSTLGRLVRLSQYTDNTGNYQFFDQGIDQQGDFYISEHSLWSTGGILHKKMITVSPQDFVGINFNWGEHPTANFHTKGTVRFEGVNANNALTRVLVMDANGNVASRDASTLGGSGNDWALTGNSGTTAANFLGTTDNAALNFRVSNLQRLSISNTVVGSNNIGYIIAGEQSTFSTQPAQFSVWGKDINGYTIPLGIAASVVGMNWNTAAGSTLGRLMRLSQFTDASTNYQFYDQGIDQQGDFYISEHSLWSTGGILHKKMITVSPQDFVGINFNWGEHPSANFHTKGTVRFEGVNANNALTRVLVMDANGNLASRDASTIGSSYWLPDANGIYYNAANVGVGGNSRNDSRFSVIGSATQNWAMDITSPHTWQTALNIKNTTTTNAWFQLVVGGSANSIPGYGVGAGNFGIVNAQDGINTTIPLIITSNNMVGLSGVNGGTNFTPKSRLHVQDGDVYIDKIGSGVIMKSPNGTCWRMTVSDAGAPVFTSITCP